MSSETFVVVGAGLAAGRAVTSMREAGFDGHLVVVGNEPHLPYERPPLSKSYLMGQTEFDAAFVHPSGWYEEHDVDVRLGTTVTGIDRAERALATDDNGRIGYDALLLTTGAIPRTLPQADESGASVAYLRTVEDSDRIKAALTPGSHVAVVGAGWIGLEVAAAARTAGATVTVVESLDLPLLRVLGPEVAEVFAGLHREHEVDLRTSAHLTRVEAAGDRAVLHLRDGADVEADLVVVGIGVTPNSGLAEAAGIDVDNGILVDEYLRTSDPRVYAAGDVANAWHPLLGRRLRVEHWDTAIGQGSAVGRTMAGQPTAYDRLPYFFTDQYDLGMEYIGALGPEGYDEVILRGDLDSRVFTAFWVSHGQVVAGMHANDWDAITPVRAIVEAGDVDLARLRDDSVGLEAVLQTG